MWFRKILGSISRWLSPGYSYCTRCGISWKFTKLYTTMYSDHKGCFALCDKCWLQLTAKERLPYYAMVFKESIYEYDWESIRTAVLEEN